MPDPTSAYFARKRQNLQELDASRQLAVAGYHVADFSDAMTFAVPGVPTMFPVRTFAIDPYGNLVPVGSQNAGPMTQEQMWATSRALMNSRIDLDHVGFAAEYRRRHG